MDTASREAGKLTFGYERSMAEETFASVEDVADAELGFIAAKDQTEGLAVAVDKPGALTVTLLNMGLPEPQYRTVMRTLLGAARNGG